MRKNKFVNPHQKGSDIQIEFPSPNSKDQSHSLMQNKIHFPASYQDKLMPYKIQSTQQKHTTNFGHVRSNQLYDIKERTRSKDGNERRLNYGRHNKFEKPESESRQETTQNTSRGLVKYNTIELKNLQGINSTASGTTIYRSKNIKSSGKLFIERSISKRGKS